MSKYKKILAINFGGIGDEILFFPTLRSIKQHTGAEITLVCEPRSASCKELTEDISSIIKCDIKGKDKYIHILKFLFSVWGRGYDVVVSSGGTKLVSILLFLTGIKERYGYNSGKLSEILLTKAAKLNQQQYAANMYHDLASILVPEAVCTTPVIDITEENINLAKETLTPTDKETILIHPGVSQMSISKGMVKFWESKRWAELVLRLLSSGKYRVILAGSRDDKEIADNIKEELVSQNFDSADFIDMVEKTKSLSHLAALIKLSDALVCVDSAPMHIGVGVGTKTVAIFGPTDDYKLIPQSEKVIAVKVDNLECRPCLWDKRQTTCDNTKCLDIPVEAVFKYFQ